MMLRTTDIKLTFFGATNTKTMQKGLLSPASALSTLNSQQQPVLQSSGDGSATIPLKNPSVGLTFISQKFKRLFQITTG